MREKTSRSLDTWRSMLVGCAHHAIPWYKQEKELHWLVSKEVPNVLNEMAQCIQKCLTLFETSTRMVSFRSPRGSVEGFLHIEGWNVQEAVRSTKPSIHASMQPVRSTSCSRSFAWRDAGDQHRVPSNNAAQDHARQTNAMASDAGAGRNRWLRARRSVQWAWRYRLHSRSCCVGPQRA